MSDMNLKSYSDTSYRNEELKSLTRYSYDKVKEQTMLKASIVRLINILFSRIRKISTLTEYGISLHSFIRVSSFCLYSTSSPYKNDASAL